MLVPRTLRQERKLEQALVIGAARTAVGRGHPEKGMFREVHPADLLGQVFAGLLERAGVPSSEVDNVIAGCVYQIGEQSSGITRNAWLQKGLDQRAGATTVDIRCGSGQQAVHFGALRIGAGVDEVVVVGGVEHMSRIGFAANADGQDRWGAAFTEELRSRYDLVPQGISAELIADRWSISRMAMDALALESHRRATAARAQARREILPIVAGGIELIDDQGVRPQASAEALAALKPAFREDGRVTAGNSSQVSDGAAALLLTSSDYAARHGLRARARIVDQVVLGVDPVLMLTGPIPATRQILERNGLRIEDVDVIEINEAFASVVLAWLQETGADPARVNPRGGSIALGHPLGSTGARLLTSILYELEDLDGELGLVTMCCGGGVGTATLIQRI